MKKLFSLLAFSLVLPLALRAELELPAIIGDHMVLQQNLANPIWGWDTPGTKITVSFVGKNYSTTAGDVFNGALGVALGEGRPVIEAVQFANAAAAISVTRLGAQPSAPARKQIELLMASAKTTKGVRRVKHFLKENTPCALENAPVDLKKRLSNLWSRQAIISNHPKGPH